MLQEEWPGLLLALLWEREHALQHAQPNTTATLAQGAEVLELLPLNKGKSRAAVLPGGTWVFTLLVAATAGPVSISRFLSWGLQPGCTGCMSTHEDDKKIFPPGKASGTVDLPKGTPAVSISDPNQEA